MRILIAAGISALLLGGPAVAQSHERALLNGQTFHIMAAPAGCGAARVTEDSGSALGLDYDCVVPANEGAAADTAATVGIVVLSQALSVAPRDFLIGQSQTWWPDMAPADRGANITVQTKTLANGPRSFHCIHRDDVMNLAGDAVCVLDTPTIQFLIAGRSTMAFTADEGVDAVLRATTIR